MSPALNRGWAPLRGVARGNLKYIDLPIPELYDLAGDPGETRNLLPSRAADARALERELEAFASNTPEKTRVPESSDAAARLRSLGYASGGSARRGPYTEHDDPKRLMDLDARLQEAVRQHTSGERAQALTTARGIVAERPDMRVAWMTLAQIQRDTRDLDGAIESMRPGAGPRPARPADDGAARRLPDGARRAPLRRSRCSHRPRTMPTRICSCSSRSVSRRRKPAVVTPPSPRSSAREPRIRRTPDYWSSWARSS